MDWNQDPMKNLSGFSKSGTQETTIPLILGSIFPIGLIFPIWRDQIWHLEPTLESGRKSDDIFEIDDHYQTEL